MAKLLSVIRSTQHLAPSAEMEQLDSAISTSVKTLVSAAGDQSKLRTVITAYMPILTARIDKLSRQLTVCGSILTHILSQRKSVQDEIATATAPAILSAFNDILGSYSSADPAVREAWTVFANGSVAQLDSTMKDASALYLAIFTDANRYNQRDVKKIEFYNKYAAHLQAVQDRLSRQLTFLTDSRNNLAQLLSKL